MNKPSVHSILNGDFCTCGGGGGESESGNTQGLRCVLTLAILLLFFVFFFQSVCSVIITQRKCLFYHNYFLYLELVASFV